MEHGEREQVYTSRKNLSYYRDEYRIEYVIDGEKKYGVVQALNEIKDFERKIVISYIRGSSTFNTVEMAAWIERIFNRIVYHGVPIEK